MLFNSITFLIFFAILFSIYVNLKSLRKRNILLLVASYIFYGWWSWKFLSLILLSTIIDFYLGHKIFDSDNDKERQKYRNISIVANLSILGFFKYFNFFIAELNSLLTSVGMSEVSWGLNIVLPVGISFYTFQTMSYCWDIYRKELEPVKDFFDFALFVSFFPQLVAGPIERAKHLIPQIISPHERTKQLTYEGIILIVFGMFKKVVIADNLAVFVNQVFAAKPETVTSGDVLLATLFFSWQIYCDFSGYTDIARGLGKLMGFDLMLNFKLPYFSVTPSEFWRRWHISLSSWLRDYLYIPLGGSRGKSKYSLYKNLMATMVLGGLWHGAAMNFIYWGFYQGAILVAHRLYENRVKFEWSKLIYERSYWILCLVSTQIMVLYGWLIFRVNSSDQLLTFTKKIFDFNLTLTSTKHVNPDQFLLILGLYLFQVIQYRKGLTFYLKFNKVLSFFIMGILWGLIMVYYGFDQSEFIYFQF